MRTSPQPYTTGPTTRTRSCSSKWPRRTTTAMMNTGVARPRPARNQNSQDDTHMTDISDEEPHSSPTLNLKQFPTPTERPWPAICEQSWRTASVTPTKPSSITPKRPRWALPETKLRHISPLRLRHEYAQVELEFHLNGPNTTVPVDTGCSDMLVDEGWLKTLSPNAQLFTLDKPNVMSAVDGPISLTK